MAQNQSVGFSPYPAAPSSSTLSTIEQHGAPAAGDSLVAYPVGPGQSVRRPSLGESSQTRSVDSSSGHDFAPLAGIMEAMGVAPERNGLMCSGLSAETTNTIINSRAPSTRCLYAFK